ncbi:glycosyltransferase family 39 protein [Streptomyces tanashiensis]|uniref:Glycosyltransferase family 39 protein n=1 Tax=Streptomyces tanashiensis TaxID=67367 RepID=A0ABY6QVZ5_9ACTN|nr:glycosyltransferase family 39 protein [Streptomyces tanashiensis]UZX21958.1 glycosyltransferase family 39 protein [Streptomyces tanashiensis]GGY04136.1 membrane protein [Streptomyces tanashiensis]
MPLPRPRRPDRATLAALGGYAATRLVGLVVLAIAAGVTGKDGLHRLKGRWDSVWYVRIAEHGYGYQVTLPNGDVHSDLAFFPLLPALERGLSAVLPLDAATAGLLVSWTAGLAAAWGIARCGTHAFGPRAGVLLAVLWGVYPTAFVQSMAYTETLFTALAAWSLYAVLRGRWILAGVLCAVAGLTRPTAAALIAALGVTALVTLVRERRLPARTVAGVLIAPLGWLAYVAYVGVREASPTAYFDVQAAWGNSIDGGVALARFIVGLPWPASLGLCAALALLGRLLALCVRQGQPLPLLVYTIGVVFVSLVGAAYFGSRPRLMMPAFGLLLPPAVALARVRTRTALPVLAGLALASGVYGAFTLLGSGPP